MVVLAVAVVLLAWAALASRVPAFSFATLARSAVVMAALQLRPVCRAKLVSTVLLAVLVPPVLKVMAVPAAMVAQAPTPSIRAKVAAMAARAA